MFYFVVRCAYTSRACHVYKLYMFEYKFNNVEDVNIVFWNLNFCHHLYTLSDSVQGRIKTLGPHAKGSRGAPSLIFFPEAREVL